MDGRPAQTAGLGRRTRKNLTRINGMYINKRIMKEYTGYEGCMVPALLRIACRKDIDCCGVSKLRIIYN